MKVTQEPSDGDPRRIRKPHWFNRLRQIACFSCCVLVIVAGGLLFTFWKVTSDIGFHSRSLTYAKQVALSCKLYALDHNGAFPPATTAGDSNAAYNVLIKEGYFPDEKNFWIGAPGNPWCTEQEQNGNKFLDPGENNWAYFAGLRVTDNPDWPLVADGWRPGTEAAYTWDRKAKYGYPYGHQWAWKTSQTTVIRVDMSGRLEKLNGRGQVIRDMAPDGTKGNLLWPNLTNGWLNGATPLLPLSESNK